MNKEFDKIFEAKSKARKKCSHCGHTQLLGIKDKGICAWCGHYIFKDSKTEFEYRLKEGMLKESRTM